MNTETDPYLSDLLSRGYQIFIDIPMDIIKVFDQEKQFVGTINCSDLRMLCYGLTIKTSILYTGEKHHWVSEVDGSADRLRDFINDQLGRKIF